MRQWRALTVALLAPVALTGWQQQSSETVLKATAVLQHCSSTESACGSGPMNELVGIRIERGAVALLERTGPIMIVLGATDTIAAPTPAGPNAPANSEFSRLLGRAGLARADSLAWSAPRAEPPAGAQPDAGAAPAIPFARVYARQQSGIAVVMLDITALRRHPRFEPSRTIRVIWPGADGRTYAASVRVP